MAEYREKVAALEDDKTKAGEEVRRMGEVHAAALLAKDGDIAEVREEVEREMRRDINNLGEEMAGLNAAYAALEREYHDANGRCAAAEAAAAEAEAVAEEAATAANAAMSLPAETTAGGETAAESGPSYSSHAPHPNPSSAGEETAAEDPHANTHADAAAQIRTPHASSCMLAVLSAAVQCVRDR